MTLAPLGPHGTWRDRQVTPTYSARSPDLAPDLAEHPRALSPASDGRCVSLPMVSTAGPRHQCRD
eukprot:scaffold8015_cov149-Isochrysis_galbana.AAC.6